MKRILFLFLLSVIVQCTFSQGSFEVVFDAPFGSLVTDQPTIVESAPKEVRFRSNRGNTNIRLNIDEAAARSLHPLAEPIIRDVIQQCEQQFVFKNDNPVMLTFQFTNLASNAYRVFDTYKNIETNGKIIGYPLMLAVAMDKATQEINEKITILLNNNALVWFFEGDQESNLENRYDFKTAVLRAIIKVMGFKSGLQNKKTPRINSTNKHSIFDFYLLNSINEQFISFDNNNLNALGTFVTGDNIYWKTPNTGYKIYAPSVYKRGLSLNYFDSENELMSYDFKSNRGIWQIDDKTRTILHDIGWQLRSGPLKIHSIQIDETGIANINNTYTFTASAQNASISDYYWEYRLKKNDGSFDVMQSGTTSTFTISPVSPLPIYERNSDGYITGEIVLQAKVNGVLNKTYFRLYLGAKPGDINASFALHQTDEWGFYADMSITAPGANKRVELRFVFYPSI